MATTRNLYVDQGADFSLPFTISDALGNPLNLLGYEVVSVMKRSYGALTSIPLSIEIPSPLDGQIVLWVTAETSLGVRAGRYVYDVLIVDENGKQTRVLEGIVTISPAVTKLSEVL